MMLLGVLILAVGALASPAIIVPPAGLEYPFTWPIRSMAVKMVDGEEKVVGIPGAPILEPLSLINAIEIEPLPEPGKENEEIEKEKDGEMIDGEIGEEKEIEKEKTEEPKKPELTKFDINKIPEFFTNFWATYFPNIHFPSINLPPIFVRPPPPGTPEAATYRLLYNYNYYPFVNPGVRIIEKK